MTDAPTSPATATEARTQLSGLMADPAWGASILAGNPDAIKQMQDLTTKVTAGGADVVDAVMKGEIPKADANGFAPSDDIRRLASTAEMFRDLGIRDDATAQILRGEKVTEAEYVATSNWKKTAMGDQDFVKKFLAGDSVARQKMLLADSILVNGFKTEKAA
jgi:hypothetical protein